MFQKSGSPYKIFFVLFCGVLFSSCKKFVTIDAPADQLVKSNVFTSDASATAAVTGIYSEMMNNMNQFTNGATSLYAGLCADELYYYTPSSLDEFASNQITIANHNNLTSYFWKPAYQYIYSANLAIEGLTEATTVSVAVKNQLIGEAKFIRAFCYFYLVNLFGDVPMPVSTDFQVNNKLPRVSKSDLYKQITDDLIDARNKLGNNYPSSDKVRPNKAVATALLARVYLYKGDWMNAEEQASQVINNAAYALSTDLNKVFLKNSSEAIWQLLPVNPNFNTYEGNAILPASVSDNPKYLITEKLLNDFEPGDQRKPAWIDSRVFSGQTLYYPNKYKVYGGSGVPVTEYYTVLRLAEQYLIRAEAKAHQNSIPGAQADLNAVRNRAGLGNATANSKEALLSAIEKERRVELFSEWGHRWLDLKRTGRADVVLSVVKGATWSASDTLWPIPQDQINLNPALTQNPGY